MSQVIDAGIGGNSRVFFVKGDRTAIVDTGAPGNERNILRALRVAGIPRGQVSVIVVTHAHCDHYGSLHQLKAALNVPVIAGWPDAEFVEKGENAPAMNLTDASAMARAPGPKVAGVKVDVVAREDMGLEGYGIDAHVLTTPGHTGGSLSVLAGNGDCATGDFLASLYSGDPGVVGQSLKKLNAMGAKRLYPSHAPYVETIDVLGRFLSEE